MSLAHARPQPALSLREGPRIEPPVWTKTADALLAWAEPCVRLLGCLTPTNLDGELAKLTARLERGDPSPPAFRYPDPPVDDPSPVLERAAEELEPLGELGQLYAARARELAIEATMSRSAGAPILAALAAHRYGPRDRFHEQADELAARWLDERLDSADDGSEESVISDDDGTPTSLVSRLRCEVGRRRLPFRVQSSDGIAALAATGPDVIYVARGRRLTIGDVERTVLHEIEGHALPRSCARGLLGLFARGTAFGSDDQEGRALLLEQRHGRLGPRRRRELARRHLACRLVRRGADFVETARALASGGANAADAVRIAARAHRGGGLARESVYLPALLRVEAALGTDPSLDRVLASGQVAVEAAPFLSRYLAAD